MSKTPHNERLSARGFSVVEVVVVLAIVAVLGLGGLFVWQRNKDDTANKTDQTSQNDQTKQNNKDEEPNDPSEDGKYLVIDEWGARIPLSDGIVKAYYTFSSDNLGEYVSLYDAAFDSTKNANGVSCGEGAKYVFYVITRATPENAASEDVAAPPEFKEFSFTNEYVFGGLGAHQAPPACANLNADPNGPFEGDERILEIANEKEQAFDAAFAGLQKAE